MHICPAEIAAAVAVVPAIALAPYAARRAWSFVCRCCSNLKAIGLK